MRLKWPLTFAYLNEFKEELLNRANYWKFFGKQIISRVKIDESLTEHHVRLKSSRPDGYEYEVSDAPFYAMFNIGPYTFAPYRVCWSRMANTIKAAVVSEIPTVIGQKPPIPTDTATIAPFESKDRAHYFCAVVNSSPFRWFVKSFSAAGRGFGSAAILKHISIPTYDQKNRLHTDLTALSLDCHQAAQSGQPTLLQDLETKIDSIAAQIWTITRNELNTIQIELADAQPSRQREVKRRASGR